MTANHSADYDTFLKESLHRWHLALESLVSGGTSTATWHTPTQILQTLATIAGSNINHMFFPTMGGLELEGVAQSREQACIEIHTGAIQIVRPMSLSLVRAGDGDLWSYLRLESGSISPSGVYSTCGHREELTELPGGEYRDRGTWDSGTLGQDANGDDIDLPNGSRLVVRHLAGGPFVIFAKASLYNQDPSTYDGRHAKMSAHEFKSYVSDLATTHPRAHFQ